jgi:anti-sigma factor RsiW
MKCESVREKLTAYLDGELEGERGSAVRGHLRGCEACRQVASDEAALRDGLRALPSIDPPASLWAGVQQRLAAAEVADSQRPTWRRALGWLSSHAPQIGLASAALAAAIVLIVVRMQRDDDTGGKPTAPVATSQQPTEPKQVPVPSVQPSQSAHDDGDVTAALAAEPAQITASYAQTAHELLDAAKDARAQWSEDRKRDFDSQLAALQKKVASATDERPRREAYRKLIRYLQRAVIDDDVALASVGGSQ